MSTSRKRSASTTRTKSRYSSVLGYDRSAGGLTAQARQRQTAAAIVSRFLEKKGVDTRLTIAGPILATTNTNADCIVCNLVQQGAGSWNRVGRKITLQSLRLRGLVQWFYQDALVSGDIVGNTLRVVVVWDKQPSGNTPTFDAVFSSTLQDGTETTSFLDPMRYDNMDRFTILSDTVMDFNANLFNGAALASDGVTYNCSFDKFIPLKNKEVIFSGQTNPMTIADISSGGLYVYFRARSQSSGNALSINSASTARLRYIDA